jgi:hypothetical protein
LHPFFIVTDVDQGYYYVGMNVQKMGRTTGWTSGAITGTCVDQQNGGLIGFYTTTCAYRASYVDQGGDSGGPVFTFPGTTGAVGDLVALAGVHFGEVAGTGPVSVFSKYSRIANDFGGTLVATRPISLATPSVSGSLNFNSPRIAWPAVPGATRYQIMRGYSDGSTWTYTYLLQVTGTSFTDGSVIATQYNGTTPLYSGMYARYEVVALGGSTEVSGTSTSVYFVTTNICSGKC